MVQQPTATAHTLRTSETLYVDIFQPGAMEPPAPLNDIRDLVVQPQEPWFDSDSREEVERGLHGKLADTSQEFYFLGRVGTRHVGVVWYQVSRRSPEIGAYGYVFTEPAHRGKGISYHLGMATVDHFRQREGLCLYLGTGNPVAHRVYERCGFRDYNGIAMRYVAPPNEHEGFDERLFAWCGPAQVRPVEWGDAGMIDAIYTAPNSWLIRDYGLRSFSHPAVQQSRCHVFAHLMMSVEREGGACLVLDNPRHRLVGAGVLRRGDKRVEPHVGTVDFVVQPAYVSQARELLEALVGAAGARGCRVVQAYLASCDREKKEVAKAAGFGTEAILASRLRAGDEAFDLEVWSRRV